MKLPSSRPEPSVESGLAPDDGQVRAGESPRISEEQRSILDALPMAIVVVRANRVLWVNCAFTTLLGYNRDEVRDQPFEMCFVDEQHALVATRLEGSHPEPGQGSKDLLLRRNTGETLWCNVIAQRFSPEFGDSTTLWLLTDITERKEVEETLKRTRDRLEVAQAQAQLGSWEVGPDFVSRYWSKQMFNLYGFDPALGIPSTADAIARIHPDDVSIWYEATERAIATRSPTRLEFRTNPALGPIRYFEATQQVELDDAGRPLRTFGAVQDVTARKRAEEELRLVQSRLEAAQAQALIGSWELGPQAEPRYWSRQMYALFGFEPELGVPPVHDFMERIHPADRQLLDDTRRRAVERNERLRLPFRSNPSLLGQRHFEAIFFPHFDERGQLQLLTGTVQDVTEREQATEALRDSERRIQRLLENSNDLLGIIDVNGRQRSLCGPFHAIVGYEPAELEGTNSLAAVHPDDLPGIERAMAQAVSQPGIPQRVEYRYRHKNGDWVDLEAVGTSWLNDPVIQGIVVNVRDVSERKRAEKERIKLQEQLQQAIKMEAVGRLAGGVAHDFNNLLTIIAGNTQLALEDIDTHNPLVQLLIEINDAAASAASLTRQLLAFSRQQLIEPKVVSLNDLVANLRKMLARLIGEDIALELKLSADLGSVRIDPGQFEQVIMNLAVNARDAMPKGGRLTIETSNLELDEDYFRVHRDLKPGSFVALAISDSGEGMTPEVLSHIFEPFYTTKPLGSGTGLGLSVIFGVVKQAGGAIGTYSELGRGTTFRIYLPRIEESPQAIEQPKAVLESLRGSETILIVEDNDSVRELTNTMLRRLGYQTYVASSGKAALALLDSERPRIDLLLTDLIMPEMSGSELSEHVHRTCPAAAVLYCSGYTEDAFVRQGIASEHLQFIGKPFTLQHLGRKESQVLNDRKGDTSRNTRG